MTAEYDELIASMDPAMVIVTVAVDDERDGCLVGFHSQCSIDPPQHAVWLSVSNRTFELTERASRLAVHLLADGDRDLAELFGGETGDEVDKLARTEWEPGPDGIPLLARCPARFVGRIVQRGHAAGDHALFILEVVDADASERPAEVLRLSSTVDVDPGHEPDERR